VGNKSVGLFAVNREEWVIAEQACYMFANVTVPLYDTLGKEAVEFIVKQANVEICFASNDKVCSGFVFFFCG
jgi:long-chain acyl-CoA synthetase